jgi:hypothetical protein
MDGNALEELIRRLLDGKKNKGPGKKVQLSEAEIRHLCVAAKEIFLSQPNLLELEAPIKICGACVRPTLLLPCPAPPLTLPPTLDLVCS